jgi:VWFA-related protein
MRVLLFAALTLAAPAQEVRVSSRTYTPSTLVLRVDAKLVEAGVVVRDRNGHAIGGLTRGDFRIFDDGKEREITAFSVETSTGPGNLAAVPPAGSAAQTPHATAQPATEPRNVALLFDDVDTRQGDLMHARVAAERFVREALRPGDRVAICTTSGTRVLGFTADTAKLIDAIEKLSAHPRMEDGGVAPCPRITPYQAYLIVSLDQPALAAALDEAHKCSGSPTSGGRVDVMNPLNDPSVREVRIQAEQTWDQAKVVSQGTLDAIRGVVDDLAKMPGGRVLVLASSGFRAETLEYDQSRIIDRALAANVVINALDAKGLFSDTPVRTPDQLEYLTEMPLLTTIFEARTQLSALETANTPLVNLAQSTGGLFFHNSNDLTLGFRELAAVPEVTYRLGFRPAEGGLGRFHKLQVKLVLNAGAYAVQARRGYFAPAKGTETAVTPRQKLDREVSSGDVLDGFAVRVSTEESKSRDGGPVLWVSVHIDLMQLRFSRRAGHRLQGLVFVSALLDAKGNVVAAKEGRMDLELTEATFARLSLTGVNAKLSLEAAPGVYRLREVVQEAVEGKMAATNLGVRVE